MNNDEIFKPKAGSKERDRCGNVIRAPNVKKVVGTYDPNYQTLVGLDNDDIFKPKAGSKENDRPSDNKIGSRECDRATGNKIRAPDVKKVVGTYDPNYQTLVGLSNDEVFKPKAANKGPVGGKLNMPAAKPKKVSSYEDNWVSLVSLNSGEDCKPKRRRSGWQSDDCGNRKRDQKCA